MSDDQQPLPPGWVHTALEDVLEVCDNLREPVNAEERALRTGPYPYYGANGQAGTIDDYRYDGDYVLLAEDGGYFDAPARGVAYRAEGKFWVNNHAHVLKPLGEISTAFAVNALNAMDWMHYVSGTTRLKLNQSKMRSASMLVPPLPEQRRIVSKIEALQERSGRAAKALAEVGPLLEQFRQSILAAAFSGRLTADWREKTPNVEPAHELLTRIRTERRHRWEQAELAKYQAKGKQPPKDWKDKYEEPQRVSELEPPFNLPKEWVWATLDELTHSMRSGNSKTSLKTATQWPILRSSAIRNGEIDYSDVNYMPEDEPPESENVLTEGDLLVTRLSGSLEYVGMCAIVHDLGGQRIQYPDRLFRLRLSLGINDRFVALAFRNKSLRTDLENSAKSSAGHQRISLSDLRSFLVPLPPLEEQRTICDLVASAISMAELAGRVADESKSSLTQLNQSILAKAFRGELVPQDPGDEPASELLARIRNSRDTTTTKSEGGSPRTKG